MSFDKTKTDPELGQEIQSHLEKVGVHTPVDKDRISDKTNKEKISIIEDHFTAIWSTLGLDLTDDSLADTPKRMAKMYVNEIYYGLQFENFPKCTTISNKMNYNEMIVERKVDIQSNCEHHGVVIDGFATIAYIPKDKVLGLSKMNRIAEYFAKRPQVQERLTSQIYHALSYILDTEDVAVMIDAQHFCVKSRGVCDVNSRTTTSHLGGAFKSDPSTRSEFMSISNSN